MSKLFGHMPTDASAVHNEQRDSCRRPLFLSRGKLRGKAAAGDTVFYARSFVRPALQSTALYLLVIVIAMMAMVKPAQASGSVQVVYPIPAITSPLGWGTACFEMNGQGLCGVKTAGAACSYWNGQYGWTFNWTGQVIALSCDMWNCPMTRDGKTYNFTLELVTPAVCPASYVWDPVTGKCTRSMCPANATGVSQCGQITSCTCDDNYVPDPTGTSCVPAISCPAPSTSDGAGGCACNPPNRINSKGVCDACPVDPLSQPPFDDACATVLENTSSTQAQKDAACGALTENLKTGMACFSDKLSRMSPAIPMKVTSDIRDVAYQAHFRDIWDKMELLVALEDDPVKKNACAARRAEIAAEKGCDNADVCTSCYSPSTAQRSHCLKGIPALPNSNDAQHTQGNAFDVSEDYTIIPLQDALDALNPPKTIPQFLDDPANCNLIWGGTFKTNKDPVHFLAR